MELLLAFFATIWWVIALVAMVWLARRHVLADEPSLRSKQWVGGIAAVSLVMLYFGVSSLLATLLQLGLCIYVVFHQTITSIEKDLDKEERSAREVKDGR